MKSLELDALRLCLTQVTSELSTLKASRSSRSPISPSAGTYTLISPATPTPRKARRSPLTLPPELIAHILTLAHASDDLYLLHFLTNSNSSSNNANAGSAWSASNSSWSLGSTCGTGGGDPTTCRFASTLAALAPMPDVARMVASRALARIGLHPHPDLALTLTQTRQSAPVKLCVMFGVRDERRFTPSSMNGGHASGFWKDPRASALPTLLEPENRKRWRELRVEGWDRKADVEFLRACRDALPYVRRLMFVVNSAPSEWDEEDCNRIEAIFSGSNPSASDDPQAMEVDEQESALEPLQMTNLTSAHISAQYLPGFVRSGAFAHLQHLRIQTSARRGAVSLATVLASLEELNQLESLEVVEEGYGHCGGPRAGAQQQAQAWAMGAIQAGMAGMNTVLEVPMSPTESLAHGVTNGNGDEFEFNFEFSEKDQSKGKGKTTSTSSTAPLKIPSLKRIHVRGVSPLGAAALARHFRACANVCAFAMEETPSRPGQHEKAKEGLLRAVDGAFPHLESLSTDFSLPSVLAQLSSPNFPSPNPSPDANMNADSPRWLLPNLKALALGKPVAPRAVADMLCARHAASSTDSCSGVEVAQLVQLTVCLRPPPLSLPPSMAETRGYGHGNYGYNGAQPFACSNADTTQGNEEEQSVLSALEAFVPNVVRVVSK